MMLIQSIYNRLLLPRSSPRLLSSKLIPRLINYSVNSINRLYQHHHQRQLSAATTATATAAVTGTIESIQQHQNAEILLSKPSTNINSNSVLISTAELLSLNPHLIDYLHSILTDSIGTIKTDQILIVYDNQSQLSRLLFTGYQSLVPTHFDRILTINYDESNPIAILAAFNNLPSNSTVILISSDSFKLSGYRHRMELFKLNLKVIEHVHLSIMDYKLTEISNYIRALGFNTTNSYNKLLAVTIAEKLNHCQQLAQVICNDGCILNYTGGFELVKLNIGDYTTINTNTNNTSNITGIGSTYPVGEVFTESKSLSAVNGSISIYAFPNLQRQLHQCKIPIQLLINDSCIKSIINRSELDPIDLSEFQSILDLVNSAESNQLLIREFGLGINSAMNYQNIVSDITAFERQLGMHISLGSKHTVYNKSTIKKKLTRFHLDLFINVSRIIIDNEIIFENDRFTVLDSK